MLRRVQWGRAVAGALTLVLTTALALTGCSDFAELDADPAASTSPGATVTTLAGDLALPGGSAVGQAVAASSTFFATAGIVVLTASDEGSQVRASSLAMLLGVPVLPVDDDGAASPEVIAELERLGTHTVLVVGQAEVPDLASDRPMLRAVPAPDHLDGLRVVLGRDLDGESLVQPGQELARVAGARSPFTTVLTYAQEDPQQASTGQLTDLPGLPPTLETERNEGVVVVAEADSASILALATARGAGADAVVISGDLADDYAVITQLRTLTIDTVVTLADTEPLELTAYRARVAASGVEVAGGGQRVLPGLYVASSAGSGDDVGAVLDQAETAAQAVSAAAVPTVIYGLPAGVTSAQQVTDLVAAVTAAGERGVAVLLALNATDPVAQLETLAPVLDEPNVGVAVTGGDPEAVSAAVLRLADLVREQSLPPKLVLLRENTDPTVTVDEVADRPEVSVVIEVSGEAVAAEVVPPPTPAVTPAQVWAAAVSDAAPWWGWRQGQVPASADDLLALTPQPVLVTTTAS